MSEYICEAPRHYAQWVECFRILSKRMIDSEEYALLCSGVCTDSAAAITFFEQGLMDAINAMLNRCIREFNRELGLYTTFGEVGNIHIPYAHFAQNVRRSLFYCELDFLSEQFRQELTASLKKEILHFWEHACRSLNNACIEQYQPELEDELYLVRRIRLFDEETSL